MKDLKNSEIRPNWKKVKNFRIRKNLKVRKKSKNLTVRKFEYKMSFVSFSDYCVFFTIFILHRIILGLLLSMCDFQSKLKKFSRPRSSKILIWKFFCSFISSFSIHWYTEKTFWMDNSIWNKTKSRTRSNFFLGNLKKFFAFF